MRYFIGLLVTVGLIVLILVLLLSGGNTATVAKPLTLLDYANDNPTAQLIIDGPIIADQDHREVQIDVTPSEVSFTLLDGYQQTIENTQTYTNNARSFAVFSQALQHAGFTKGNSDPTQQDERGFCPTGVRDIYSFSNGSKQLMRYWSTSCGQGTFKGTINVVTNLFRQQVPDYNTLIKNVDLY